MADVSVIKLPNGSSYNVKDATARSYNYAASSSQGGDAKRAVKITPTVLTNENLNSIVDYGFYYAAGGNTVANKPSGISSEGAFGLLVERVATGWVYQEYTDYSTGKQWYRTIQGSSVSNWAARDTNTTYTLSSISGTLPVNKGGTGATDAATARTNLGITPANIGAATSGHTHDTFSSSGNGFAPSTASGNLSTTDVTSAQYVLTNDGKWHTLPDNAFKNDNTWTALKGATTSAAGTAGYAPAPAAGAANRYLRSDGTWAVPPNDNTTYSVATQSANGLMSSADKKKLDNFTTGAQSSQELTIPSSGWSSSTTSVNGSTYYTYSTTSIANLGNPHPTILCSSASGTVPSPAESAAFSCIAFVTVDTSSSKITFYASKKPSANVVLIVQDYTISTTSTATKTVSIATSDWSSSAATVNGTAYYTAKKTVSGIGEEHPPVICSTASTSAVLPSESEQTAYNYIDYTTVDLATNIATFYAIKKPTATVVAMII